MIVSVPFPIVELNRRKSGGGGRWQRRPRRHFQSLVQFHTIFCLKFKRNSTWFLLLHSYFCLDCLWPSFENLELHRVVGITIFGGNVGRRVPSFQFLLACADVAVLAPFFFFLPTPVGYRFHWPMISYFESDGGSFLLFMKRGRRNDRHMLSKYCHVFNSPKWCQVSGAFVWMPPGAVARTPGDHGPNPGGLQSDAGG